MSKSDEVLTSLSDLLRMDDVLACMLAKKGLEGLVPKGLKIKNIDLWKTINQATNDLFTLIDKFYNYGIGRVYVELGEYTVTMVPISSQMAIIVITASLANLGLLDVEMENTRRQIKKILESKTD